MCEKEWWMLGRVKTHKLNDRSAKSTFGVVFEQRFSVQCIDVLKAVTIIKTIIFVIATLIQCL